MNYDHAAKIITPATVIDGGANKGHWHNDARLRWPNAHFILIEGNAECEQELRQTGAETHIALLSDKPKTLTFYTRKGSPGCTGASAYREQTSFYEGENAVATEHQATTLDILLAGRDLAEPILIKLDLQGAELDALRGGMSILSKASAVILEESFEEYNAGAPLQPKVRAFMLEQGFRPDSVLETVVHPILRHPIQESVLYVR